VDRSSIVTPPVCTVKTFLQKNFIALAILLSASLIVISAGLSFHHKQVMQTAYDQKSQAELIKSETLNLFQVLRSIDISIRGFALMQEDRFFYFSVEEARRENRNNFHRLDSILAAQNYPDRMVLQSLEAGVEEYIVLYERMEALVRQDSLAAFKRLLGEDKGHDFVFWDLYHPFADKLFAHQDELLSDAEQRYQSASRNYLVLQGLLVLLGLPTLVGLWWQLRMQAAHRSALLAKLAANNSSHLFDEGKPGAPLAEQEILAASMENLQKAAYFVQHVAGGNYQVDWPGLTPENQARNQATLAGKLVGMRDQLKTIEQQTQRENWAREGLNKLAEIIRSEEQSLPVLCQQVLQFLVNYTKSQQGSLFVCQPGETAYLDRMACYAFDRKKYGEKRIQVGQGLIGQTFLEGETVLLGQLPPGYMTITSGLGEATPNQLAIIPFKQKDQVMAVLEIATFRAVEAHQVTFLEKAGAIVAAAVATTQSTQQLQQLLAASQAQAAKLQAQEEELRQNQEELQATQEEISRRYNALFQQLSGQAYQATFNQLKSINATKKRSIEYYFGIIRNQICTFAEDQMITNAVKEFKQAYSQVGQCVPESGIVQAREQLKNYYQQAFLPRLNEPLGAEAYLPKGKVALLLQQAYLAQNPHPPGKKLHLNQAPDQTAYSQVHGKYHPLLRSFLEKFGYYDLFLLDAQTGDMLYSVFKEVDFATNLLEGPNAATNFGRVVRAAIESERPGLVRLVDFEPYQPSYGAPASFIACPVYEQDRKIGILVFQMPVDRINQILTGDCNWQPDGLGQSGETIMVGSDLALRSICRSLVEHQEEHLANLQRWGYGQPLIDQVRKAGTSVLIEKVTPGIVEQALRGHTGTCTAKNNHGNNALYAYAPLDIVDVNWVIVSSMAEAEIAARMDELRTIAK
jgi:hypothetical protein